MISGIHFGNNKNSFYLSQEKLTKNLIFLCEYFHFQYRQYFMIGKNRGIFKVVAKQLMMSRKKGLGNNFQMLIFLTSSSIDV